MGGWLDGCVDDLMTENAWIDGWKDVDDGWLLAVWLGIVGVMAGWRVD